ncbi:MAG TPA: hypothetical protein VG944_14225 [Fimbriimonas sp.]|nr:hypothetical protein [Fimbriimonas sp.]
MCLRLYNPLQATDEGEVSEDYVMLTKAFYEQEDAEREASRLNELNEGFRHYFVCVVRLVD